MADLSITAASVVEGSGAVKEGGKFGATVTAGQVVYRGTDYRYDLADSDSATAAVRSPRGVALNNGADGQPGDIVRSGPVTIGATLTLGQAYYLSDTPGGICPYADLATGDYPVLVGVAISTTELYVCFIEAESAL